MRLKLGAAMWLPDDMREALQEKVWVQAWRAVIWHSLLTAMVVLRTRLFFVTQKELVLCTAGEEQDQFRGRAGGDFGANTHSGVGMGNIVRECTS